MKKSNGVVAVILGLVVNLMFGPDSAMAQTNSSTSDDDFAAMLGALESTTPISASELPDASEIKGFYSAANPDAAPAPEDVLGFDLWPLGDGWFVLDDAHPTEAQQEQAASLSRSFEPDYFLYGSDFSTNDLVLQILDETNGIANLVIYPPWNDQNGVWDLLETTNLTSLPIDWQWVLRNAPGQTNLIDPNATNAQEFYALGLPNDLIANDSEGTNIWMAFINLAIEGGYDGNLSLYISSPVGSTGTVTNAGTGFAANFTLAAGAVTNIAIPASTLIMSGSFHVATNGIYIVASQPVSVVAFAYQEQASTAFNWYPTPLLGTNYCVMAGGDPIDSGFEIAVLATAAGTTTFTITPPAGSDFSGISTNYTTNLRYGETIQFTGADPTGTTITSSAPIAVFVGEPLAYEPNGGTPAGNPLVQEQLPVESWGTEALAMSFAGRANGDTYRILAAYSNTVVTITTTNGGLVITNQAGEFYETNGLSGPVEFQANQRIQVAHFANGAEWGSSTNTEGDPGEILLPPTGYYLETNTVFTLTNNGVTGDFSENYLTVIAAQSATNSTYVDHSLVAPADFVAIGRSGYYGAQITVTNSGAHTVISSQPVGVEVYGWGTFDAYSYFGGVVK